MVQHASHPDGAAEASDGFGEAAGPRSGKGCGHPQGKRRMIASTQMLEDERVGIRAIHVNAKRMNERTASGYRRNRYRALRNVT